MVTEYSVVEEDLPTVAQWDGLIFAWVSGGWQAGTAEQPAR